ncbi:MAG: T9SS type A sorting domain-containing protein [Chitinophagales bacterium]|nr:T9SS type A sorting domain-containing protein [Chitinophagales bacterium]
MRTINNEFVQKATFLLLIFSSLTTAKANHTWGGDIQSIKVPDTTLTYTVFVTHYVAASGILTNDTIFVSWGDGEKSYIHLQSSQLADSINGIYRNVYSGIHTYSNSLIDSLISIVWIDTSRPNNILNINNGNSASIPICIEARITLSKEINSSPLIQNMPVFTGYRSNIYRSSLFIYDADGDSLVVRAVEPLQNLGVAVPLYLFPDQYQPDTLNKYDVNIYTGEITWEMPPTIGIFAIAIVVEEYRNGKFLSSFTRDFVILVENEVSVPLLFEYTMLFLFPNPATTHLTITLPQLTQPAALTITNISGSIVQTEQLSSANTTMPINHLPAGLYFVTVQNQQQRIVKKLVKQ